MAAPQVGDTVITSSVQGGGVQVRDRPPVYGTVTDVTNLTVIWENGTLALLGTGVTESRAIGIVGAAPAGAQVYFGKAVRVVLQAGAIGGYAQEFIGIVASLFTFEEAIAAGPGQTGIVVVKLLDREGNSGQGWVVLEVAFDFSDIAGALQIVNNDKFPRY